VDHLYLREVAAIELGVLSVLEEDKQAMQQAREMIGRLRGAIERSREDYGPDLGGLDGVLCMIDVAREDE